MSDSKNKRPICEKQLRRRHFRPHYDHNASRGGCFRSLFVYFWKKQRKSVPTYTFGHDYLDAERASCPMNTHWNTMWNNRPSSTENSTFPGLGFEFQSRQFHISRSGVQIPVKAIPHFQVWGSNPSQGSFLWCDSNDNSYQSIDKVIQKIFSFDWPWQKVGRREKKAKNCLGWDSNPRLGNVEFTVELELPQHVSEEKRESALWQPVAWHSIPMGAH